mmetsp:Transcript_18627/g.39135  ORF Transcript_18627/g.39135 Transcript_18627/m.39135 type:complete len:285 (+) Transcript_18627:3091-3945(+)
MPGRKRKSPDDARASSGGLPERGEKELSLRPTALKPPQQDILEQRLKGIRDVLSEPRRSSRQGVAVAEWIEEAKRVLVLVERGKFIQQMGFFEEGKHYLFPEDALYLMDRSKLCLLMNGMATSLQRAMSVLLSGAGISAAEYYAMTHCRRVGFIVRRPASEISSGSLKISFSSWAANSFRRKAPSPPEFHLVVRSRDDPPPTCRELLDLVELCRPVQIRCALVDQGTVLFTHVWDSRAPLICEVQPAIPISQLLLTGKVVPPQRMRSQLEDLELNEMEDLDKSD